MSDIKNKLDFTVKAKVSKVSKDQNEVTNESKQCSEIRLKNIFFQEKQALSPNWDYGPIKDVITQTETKTTTLDRNPSKRICIDRSKLNGIRKQSFYSIRSGTILVSRVILSWRQYPKKV